MENDEKPLPDGIEKVFYDLFGNVIGVKYDEDYLPFEFSDEEKEKYGL